MLEKRLAKGNALKSGWIGWYPHYFRGAAENIEDVRADAQAIDRLTQVALLYLAGIIRSLPLDLRYASMLEMAREQGREHYDMQIRRAGELAVLRYDAEQNGMQEDNDVHRENADTDPEAAAALGTHCADGGEHTERGLRAENVQPANGRSGGNENGAGCAGKGGERE